MQKPMDDLLADRQRMKALTATLREKLSLGKLVTRPLPSRLFRGVRLHVPDGRPRRQMSFFTSELQEARKYAKHDPKQARQSATFIRLKSAFSYESDLFTLLLAESPGVAGAGLSSSLRQQRGSGSDQRSKQRGDVFPPSSAIKTFRSYQRCKWHTVVCTVPAPTTVLVQL